MKTLDGQRSAASKRCNNRPRASDFCQSGQLVVVGRDVKGVRETFPALLVSKNFRLGT